MTDEPATTPKDQVADAALLVMLREGIEGAGLRAIAREAGCTTGLVTHYFADRRAVIAYALDRNTARFFEGLAARSAGAATGRDRLIALMAYMAHAGDAVSSGVMFRSLASAPVDPEIAGRLRDAYDRMHAVAREAVEQGRADGSLPGTRPAADAAELAVATADGLYVAGVARPELYPPQRRDALILAAVAALAT